MQVKFCLLLIDESCINGGVCYEDDPFFDESFFLAIYHGLKWMNSPALNKCEHEMFACHSFRRRLEQCSCTNFNFSNIHSFTNQLYTSNLLFKVKWIVFYLYFSCFCLNWSFCKFVFYCILGSSCEKVKEEKNRNHARLLPCVATMLNIKIVVFNVDAYDGLPYHPDIYEPKIDARKGNRNKM